MPTKAELKANSKPIKVKVRKGDRVVIISGKDKGRFGIVAAVSPKEGKVLVVNNDNPDQMIALNAVIKHRKPRMQGETGSRVTIPSPLDISKVMVVDEKGVPTRVGRRLEDGKTVRYSKKSGDTFTDLPVMESKNKK